MTGYFGIARESRREERLWRKVSWRTDVRAVFKDAYELARRIMTQKVERAVQHYSEGEI